MSVVFNGIIIDGISYTLLDDLTARVDYDNRFGTLSTVTIPNTVVYLTNTYNIVSIVDGAFSGNQNIITVIIGNNVTTIGQYCFEHCYSLTSVTIPNSVTYISAHSFQACYALVTVNIDKENSLLTYIGDLAFIRCAFTTIILPDNLITIGASAFDSCYYLVSVYFSNSITSIGIYCFSSCVSLIHAYNFENTQLIVISNSLFENCSQLTNITLPNSTTTIQDSAFARSGLTTITISQYITNISPSAFMAVNISYINVDSNNNIYSSLDGVLFNKDQTSLLIYPYGITNPSYTIPNQVTSIGISAFLGCSNLYTVTLTNNITEIKDYAFYACTNLSSINLPNSITRIGTWAFFYNTAITTLTIPASVINIAESAFQQCYALTSVTFEENSKLSAIETRIFCACDSLQTINIPKGITSIGVNAFQNCSLRTITIPSSVTAIYPYAFTGCNYLTSIYFEHQTALPTIGSGAFGNPDGTPNPNSIAYYSKSIPDSVAYNAFISSGFLSSTEPVGSALVNIVCFKEGSKILTNTGYVKIQDLRKGDLVRTVIHGFKPICMIGKREIYHIASKERIKDQLYRCSKSQYSDVWEDLIITGCHSILVDRFKDNTQREKTIEVNGNTYVTDCKYRLPACADDRASVYEIPGNYMVYHLALENTDNYMNYGIYANGLLVESCSKRYLNKLANMTLIE